MGMVAILDMWLGRLNKLSFPHLKENPYVIWLQSALWFQRRRCLKMSTTDRHTYIQTETYLYYKFTNEPKGSGELKSKNNPNIQEKRKNWHQ